MQICPTTMLQSCNYICHYEQNPCLIYVDHMLHELHGRTNYKVSLHGELNYSEGYIKPGIQLSARTTKLIKTMYIHTHFQLENLNVKLRSNEYYEFFNIFLFSKNILKLTAELKVKNNGTLWVGSSLE